MSASRCTFTTSDHRRCTSFLYPGHDRLCHQHLRQQLDSLPPAEDVATDLLAGIHNFQSGAAVNMALGKILTLLAAGRIKRQDAIGMAYICQLLLQSLKEFKGEIRLTTYEPLFERDLLKVLNSRTPLEEFISPPLPPDPETEIELESELEPEPELELAIDAEPNSRSNSESDLERESRSVSTPSPESEINNEPDSNPISNSEIDPDHETQPDPSSISDPDINHEPDPHLEPEHQLLHPDDHSRLLQSVPDEHSDPESTI